MLKQALTAALAAAALALPAQAQDAYVIGVTGALTGPPAGTNAPPIEGLRLYVDRLNAAGGVNGKKIQLIVLDDSAEPSKAAANVKRLLTQDNVSLLILSSLSSTYAPVIAETKRANVPLMLMGAVCPRRSIRRPSRCSSAPPPMPAATTAAPRSPSSRRPRRSRCGSASPPWRSRSRAARSTMPRRSRRPRA